jgi:hypothetical protein
MKSKTKGRQKTKYVLMLPDGSLVSVPKQAILAFSKKRVEDALELSEDLKLVTLGSEGSHVTFTLNQIKRIQASWAARGIIQ